MTTQYYKKEILKNMKEFFNIKTMAANTGRIADFCSKPESSQR